MKPQIFQIESTFLATKPSVALLFASFGTAMCLVMVVADRTVEKMGALVHIPTYEVDLGMISDSRERHVGFTVANRGDRRLVINQVGCNCGSNAETTIVLPGESAQLIVILKPLNSESRLEQCATFTTNDPNAPMFDLTVRACIDCWHQES